MKIFFFHQQDLLIACGKISELRSFLISLVLISIGVDIERYRQIFDFGSKIDFNFTHTVPTAMIPLS